MPDGHFEELKRSAFAKATARKVSVEAGSTAILAVGPVGILPACNAVRPN